MPCMNSTSACESGGRVALVEDGSVLLGFPGAPGCTTTGLLESFCCDATAEDAPAKPDETARQRNGVVIFTTGLQDRTGTPAMAMFAHNAERSDFEDQTWAVHRFSNDTEADTSAMRSLLLTGDGLKLRVRQRANLWIPRKHARAGVPTQNGVVVPVRPEGFGSLVVGHCFAQSIIGVGVAG